MSFRKVKGKWLYEYFEEGRFLPDKMFRLSSSKDPEHAVLEWYFHDVFFTLKPTKCFCCQKLINDVCVINNTITGKFRNICLLCSPKIVGPNNSKKFIKSFKSIENDLNRRICPELLHFAFIKKIISYNENITYEKIIGKRKLANNEIRTTLEVNTKLLKLYKYKSSLHYDTIRLMFDWARFSESFNIYFIIMYVGITEKKTYIELREMNKNCSFLKYDNSEFQRNQMFEEFDFVGKNIEGLTKVKKGKSVKEKCGFTDPNGKIVIPLIYSSVKDFKEDLAAVRTGNPSNGKWGFINKTGEVVIPFIYDRINSFSCGMALVKHKGRWCFIDKSGNKKILLDGYHGVSQFKAGYATVWVYVNDKEEYNYKNKKVFHIDTQGKII